MTNPDPDPTISAQTALAAVIDDWFARRGVGSIGVARRWRNGAPTGEVGIRVTVDQVLPPSGVPDGELFPGELDGVPVDVVEGTAPRPE